MKRKKIEDKRKIILEFLYKNQKNNSASYGDVKPLMKGWTENEMRGTLDWLTTRLPLISLDGDKNPFQINVLIGGIPLATMENYKALAYIKPEGEKYYKENFENVIWKEFQMKFDVISKLPLLIISILSIAMNIYSSQEKEKSIDTLKSEMKNLKIENAIMFQKLQNHQSLNPSKSILP